MKSCIKNEISSLFLLFSLAGLAVFWQHSLHAVFLAYFWLADAFGINVHGQKHTSGLYMLMELVRALSRPKFCSLLQPIDKILDIYKKLKLENLAGEDTLEFIAFVALKFQRAGLCFEQFLCYPTVLD